MAYATLVRIMELARMHRKDILTASVLAVISALLGTVAYILAYRIVISISAKDAAAGMIGLALGAACAVTLRYIMLYLSSRYAHRAAFNTLYTLRMRLVEKIGLLPLGFFTETDSGTLNKVVGDDVEKIEGLLAHHIPDVVSSFTTPFFLICILIVHNPILALCSLVPMLLAFMAQKKLFQLRNKNIRHFHNSLERVNKVVIEFIRCLPAIKALNRDVISHAQYAGAIREYVDVTCDWSIGASRWYALFKVALGSGMLFIVPPGVYFITTGSLTPQELTLFLLLGLAFTAPLDRLMLFSGSLNQIIESVRRIDKVLNSEPLPLKKPAQRPEHFDIAFKDVFFSFGDRPVFSGASFHLKEGTVNAFVGGSGAGKSTAAQLIARFHDPSQGFVCIGGVDIRSIAAQDMSALVSVVFQQTFLFSDSIENNIRAGNSDVPFERVCEAAKAASVAGFIKSLPQGYNTRVGNGGIHLSGGESQRIAIARAILKNAPILLLDEATAFADPENEIRIQQGLAELIRGKTVVVIAHRLPTIVNADQIIFFGEGRALAAGRHNDLLHSFAPYAELWRLQNLSAEWELKVDQNA